MGARSLQVLGPLVPMGSTESAEVKLELEMGCHGVRTMHFGGSKEVCITTLVCAKELGAREGGPNLSHALHVKGTFKESEIPVQGQNQPTSNTGILSI